MGLWNWIVTQATGVDPAAEQARSQAADAGNLAIDQQLVEQGTWTQAQYDAAVTNMQAGNASTGANDPMGAIDQAAVEGLKEGLNNVLDAPGKAVGAVTGGAGQILAGILKAIPFWLWLAAAAGVFLWLGGGEWLAAWSRGRLARHKA